MKKNEIITGVILLWAVVASIKLYSTNKKVNIYQERYITAKEKQLDAVTYYNDIMKDLSKCHLDHATTTGEKWQCKNDLYYLRKWLQDKYNKKEI